MLPGAILAVALIVYSQMFASMFAIPKLIVLGLGAGALCLALALKGRVRKMSLTAIVMLSVYLLSAVFADDKYLAFVGNYNDYSIGILGITIATIFYLYTDIDIDKTITMLSIAGAIVGLHALVQAGIFNSDLLPYSGRAYGTIGSPVSLGIVLAILLPVAYSKSNVYALAVLLGILASGSRGALLASVAGCMIYRCRK